MKLSGSIRRLMRSLRFRLTISYVVIFALLLTAIGLTFQSGLERIIVERIREVVLDDWNAARGFLRIEKDQATWTIDPREVEQAVFVERLRRVVMIADPQGRVLEMSNAYRLFGIESPDEIRAWFQTRQPEWKEKRAGDREHALLRYGVFHSGGRPYLLVVGRRVGEIQDVPNVFVTEYFTVLPLLLIAAGMLGWFMAGRALVPVTRLAEAATRISGSSLHLRIPHGYSNDELDALIDAFNKMMERLAENFDQIRRFSTDVSHELRTPITGIRGQLEVSLMTAKTEGEFRVAITNALQDVDRLSRIVRALLTLAQGETGQTLLHKTRIDLADLVNELLDEFRMAATESELSLEGDLEPDVAIMADHTQMDRLLSNLVSNAVKYTAPGGRIRIQVSKDAAAGVAKLVVSDTGRGISPQHLPHIFDRFYRVDRKDPERGLGLGLSFVSWIVKSHDGTVDVTSELGQGTTFTVRFPLLQSGAEQPESRQAVEARQ